MDYATRNFAMMLGHSVIQPFLDGRGYMHDKVERADQMMGGIQWQIIRNHFEVVRESHQFGSLFYTFTTLVTHDKENKYELILKGVRNCVNYRPHSILNSSE